MNPSARRLQERASAQRIALATRDAFESLAHKLEFAESAACAFAFELARRYPEAAEGMGHAWVEALCGLRDAAVEVQQRRIKP